jgi:hypothetical protein
MKLSVLMPYRRETTPYRERNYELVVAHWQDYLRQLPYQSEIVTGSDLEPVFNRSRARNEAFRKSIGDIIIVADADTLFQHQHMTSSIDVTVRSVNSVGYVLPYSVYYNASQEWTDRYPGGRITEPRQSEYEHRLTTSESGVLVTTRANFEKVRGYDERFRGWGYEDNSFCLALRALCGNPYRVPGFVVHLWHPVTESVRFEQPHIQFNRDLCARYENAHTTAEMEALVEEHKCVSA